MAELLAILQIVDVGLTALTNLKVDFVAFNAARDKARAEGRSLTAAELKSLADEAQKAIDAI